MDPWYSSIFKVSIDFERSHLFFPTLISWLLLLVLALIVLVHGRDFLSDIRTGKRSLSIAADGFDSLRFFSTIALTIAYFVAMEYVGAFFPNTGLGFLLMSIPYMFALSLLYGHKIGRKKFMAICLNALIAPVTAWYVLARLFNITLP